MERARTDLESQFGALVTAQARLTKKSEFAVECGDPEKTILRMAETWDADLIAMGAHKPGTLATHFPGDLVYDIVCCATCAVMTVRD